jgi:UDP-N-acetylglucosamine 2-epimerase (non-hydrolysing)
MGRRWRHLFIHYFKHEAILRPIKIILVVGARPNFMKIAPIWRACEKRGDVFDPVLVHTEQHYDDKMSQIFFDDLELPKPHYQLGVGSGSQAVQTARVMMAFEPVVIDEAADLVVVVGDVNSTVACAMVAKKLNVKVAHVEAGLRSRDRSMPEEINRLMTDVISDLLLTPSRDADENLRQEGVAEDRIHFVGNVMIDSLRFLESKADASSILDQAVVDAGEYALVTLHRPSNVDDRETFLGILRALDHVQKQVPIVWPLHPRTAKMIDQLELREMLAHMENVKLIDPVGYLDALKLQKCAKLVLTDSGGLQEETTAFGVPCLTMRENTERPVTINEGTNTLVGVSPERIIEVANQVFDGGYDKTGRIPEGWDGQAAERMVGVFEGLNVSTHPLLP